MACIRIFLLENDHELNQLFWRRINKRIKGNRALTLDRIPTHQEFKTILGHMPIHGKALYLILLSSGIRIGETLEIRIPDLDFYRSRQD
jgi:integrase